MFSNPPVPPFNSDGSGYQMLAGAVYISYDYRNQFTGSLTILTVPKESNKNSKIAESKEPEPSNNFVSLDFTYKSNLVASKVNFTLMKVNDDTLMFRIMGSKQGELFVSQQTKVMTQMADIAKLVDEITLAYVQSLPHQSTGNVPNQTKNLLENFNTLIKNILKSREVSPVDILNKIINLLKVVQYEMTLSVAWANSPGLSGFSWARAQATIYKLFFHCNNDHTFPAV